MLAFVGTFTFSTSVLNNVTDTNVYKLAVISIVIGFVFYNLVGMLIDFIKEINGKSAGSIDGKKTTSTSKLVNVLLIAIILVSLLGYGISHISLPEKVYIGILQEQVQGQQMSVESVEETEN